MNKGGRGGGGKTEEVGREEKGFGNTVLADTTCKEGRTAYKGQRRVTSLYTLHWHGQLFYQTKLGASANKHGPPEPAGAPHLVCVMVSPVCLFLGGRPSNRAPSCKCAKNFCVHVLEVVKQAGTIWCGKAVTLCSISSFRPTFHPQVPARETPSDCPNR